MSYAHRQTIAVTTDGSGDATVYSEVATGEIHSVTYTKDATTPFSDGVDFTITLEATGENVWTDTDINATETVYPRAAVHSAAGAAVTYDGTRPIYEGIVMANDRVKIVIGSGGATKLGSFSVVVS